MESHLPPLLLREGLMKDKRKKHKKGQRVKGAVFLFLIFAFTFGLSAAMLLGAAQKTGQEQTELAMLAAVTSEPISREPFAGIDRYKKLYEQNPHMAGWIQIEGTRIDYPVMLTPKEPEHYLHRAFDGSYSYSGIPFVGSGGMDSDNVIVYGHNMKNGTMFSDLLMYADKRYWEQHPIIRFPSLYEDRSYEIIAAFYAKVHYRDEKNVFRYYNYGGDLLRPEFEEYLKQIKQLALYDTGITSQYGDSLLTLSTCSYHVKNGRFVVVARKLDSMQ